jgi:preprotein translocase subunit SecG
MILTIFQVIVAGLLIAAILLQMQGTGLTGAFGGSGEFYRSKRSVEKLLLYGTVILAVLFAAISIAMLFPH